MFELPILGRVGWPRRGPQPFSPQTAAKASRLRGAHGHRERLPLLRRRLRAAHLHQGRHSSSTSRATRAARSTRGRSAPRGPTRSSSPSTRTASRRSCTAPRTPTEWETKPLDWAMDQIAQRVKEARDADFIATNDEGRAAQRRAQHRHPRRGDARHRGELPHQEAVLRRAWAWSRSRTRREYDTPPRCPVWAPRSAAARPPTTSRTWPTATASCSWARTWPRPIPVGFRWPMKAKEKGATLIHVDPRFTRTSALCDLFVGIRAGTDIAFLGGLIHYVLTQRALVQGIRPRLHQRLDDHRGGLPGHRGPGRPVQRLRRGDATTYDAEEGHWGYEESPSESNGRRRRAGVAKRGEQGVHGYGLMGGATPHATPRRT